MKLAMLLMTTMIAVSAGFGGCAKREPLPAPVGQPQGQIAKPATGADVKLPPPSIEKLSPAEQKLDAALLELVRAKGNTATDPALAAWSAKHHLATDKGRIGVDITCRTPQQAARIEKVVKDSGGEIVSKFENTVYARVAPSAVMTLAKMAEVWTVAATRKVIGK